MGDGKTVVGAAFWAMRRFQGRSSGEGGHEAAAEEFGDQGCNARTDIKPVRIDTRKKSLTAWRPFKQHAVSSGGESSPCLESPMNKMVQDCHLWFAVMICHLLLLQTSALQDCEDAQGCFYLQGLHLQLHLLLCVVVAD